MEFDTIAAISTALGEGGIAIIRVSGDNSIDIVNNIYKGKKNLSEAKSNTINYGYIIDDNEEIIDEVLVSVMRAPKTFTKENIVEVNCHGGVVAAKRVLDIIIDNGARLAEPGEFTKRAFLNGRIDLSQAEGIIDLIRSKTDKAMKLAMDQVEGKLSNKVKKLRKELLELLAHIEVTIDYPEHDVESVTHNLLLVKINEVNNEIKKLLDSSKNGKVLREGISTVIIGRPNVGKSSLLNTILNENKAIVTEIPGTTRDVIEEYININGIPLRIVDTAGIRETDDIIERIGVEKSRSELEKADLVLLVFNFNETLTEDDIALINLVRGLKTIVVINKTDLPKQLDIDYINNKFNESPIILTSIKEDIGINELEQAISNLFLTGEVTTNDFNYVSNTRHITLLKKSKRSLDDATLSINAFLPIDMIAIDIKNSYDFLGDIIGESVSEDLTDQIFSQFCVGK